MRKFETVYGETVQYRNYLGSDAGILSDVFSMEYIVIIGKFSFWTMTEEVELVIKNLFSNHFI